MKKTLISISLAAIAVFTSSCDDRKTTTDDIQSKQNEELIAEAQRQVGMPNVTNFTQRKFFKMIIELCDEEVTTYTYIVDMNGKKHFLCESIGYGIPFSTQYTNPSRIAYKWLGQRHGSHKSTLPQADPNGLFMPTTSDATWVLAVNKEGGDPHPIYVESEILVSPFRFESEN